jgi:hypothetical protein
MTRAGRRNDGCAAVREEDYMQDRPLGKVHLGDGQGDGFWDVGFDELQLLHAEVETPDLRSICVSLDSETGELTLSEGYTPGSRQDRDEQSLFHEFEDSIVREMTTDHRFRNETAFLARSEETAFQRDELLAALDATLAALQLDPEPELRER